MKVYAKHQKIQDYLLQTPMNGVEVVDEPTKAHYIITGRFSENEYHDNLRGIIIPYTGHNGIDLDVMRTHNLELYVTPTRSRYVAEKAMALTLGVMGKVHHYHNLLSEGNWAERNSESRVPWDSLYGKSVGLLGYGRIGKIIHKMLQGFSCEVFTIDREKEYPDTIKLVKNLTNLFQMSDVIIVSLPLNEETESLIDQRLLSRAKNKFIINVGRGKVIHEESLYNALVRGTLKGFASDVWYQYPSSKELCYPSKFPIYELPNVLMSNHSGGYTVNTNEEVNIDLVQSLEKIASGNKEDQLDIQNLL